MFKEYNPILLFLAGGIVFATGVLITQRPLPSVVLSEKTIEILRQEVKNYDDCCAHRDSYYELYHGCQDEINLYVQQSRDAICLEELADWYDEMQEFENDYADLMEVRIDCREKLFVCEMADRLKVKNNR